MNLFECDKFYCHYVTLSLSYFLKVSFNKLIFVYNNYLKICYELFWNLSLQNQLALCCSQTSISISQTSGMILGFHSLRKKVLK